MDSRRPDTREPGDSATQRELAEARRHIDELTEELEATNRGIIALHSELDRARESEAQARAEHEVLAERERIAGQLHEQVIRHLLGASLDLTGTLHVIHHPTTAARLQRVIDDIDAAVRQLRGTIFDLHTPERPAGLQFRLVQLISEAHDTFGLTPTVNITGGVLVESVPADVTAHVLAAAGDAMALIGSRQHVTTAELTLHVGDDVLLSATDDGADPPSGPDAETSPALRELERRAQTLGGTCRLTTSTGGAGNRLEWRVPLRAVPGPSRSTDG